MNFLIRFSRYRDYIKIYFLDSFDLKFGNIDFYDNHFNNRLFIVYQKVIAQEYRQIGTY